MLAKLVESFILGLLAPLAATCVIPLYPGFISFLANKSSKSSFFKLGLLVAAGVISFMLLLGLIFTTIFQQSLTRVIQIISPIAFILLAIVSVMMIIGVDLGGISARIFPQVQSPLTNKPGLSAFLYGAFFGAIIIPCNPGIIAIFFTRVSTTAGFLSNIASFLLFAIGMATPLLVLALLAQTSPHKVSGFLSRHERAINRIAGIIMLIISLYYLFFVFSLV